ncbi:hypothetical protein NLU13_5583 [Sarocladium strictum]|uniref:Glycosyl transferase CAP10 domain-containing protein n=1 Tax=Sarocladium strictum TaxID=5046 RepID=A0AA39GH64_SARSR|nr:hypothetical protein NLU13_5583 [Sarocladium strictum]
MKEIDDEVARGPLEVQFQSGVILQARIENNQLFILRSPHKNDLSQAMRHRQLSTLHQLHRSLLTSPCPLPNTTLSLSAHDVSSASTIAFARPLVSPSDKRILPMPHFSFWSWPLPFIGSIPSAARRIAEIEEASGGFGNKDGKAVWRGTSWFNNGAGASPRGRQDLLRIAKGKSWADVEALQWEVNSEDASNALRIEDFCKRKYIIHTEGFGYSGRLQFHQLCASVVLSPPLEWMQHTSHLIRPVLSSILLSKGRHAGAMPKWEQRARTGWTEVYTTDEANMVFVRPDWEDLEEVISWLEANPGVAEGIAKRQRETFEESGYLSPAAEVCYWRALIRGWAEISRPTGDGWETGGQLYEEFVTVKQVDKEAIADAD